MHLTSEQIEARLDWIRRSPTDNGSVEGLCIRPKRGFTRRRRSLLNRSNKEEW